MNTWPKGVLNAVFLLPYSQQVIGVPQIKLCENLYLLVAGQRQRKLKGEGTCL